MRSVRKRGRKFLEFPSLASIICCLPVRLSTSHSLDGRLAYPPLLYTQKRALQPVAVGLVVTLDHVLYVSFQYMETAISSVIVRAIGGC